MTNETRNLIANAKLVSNNGVDCVYQVATGFIGATSQIVSTLRRSGLHAWAAKGDGTARDYLTGKTPASVLVRIPAA